MEEEKEEEDCRKVVSWNVLNPRRVDLCEGRLGGRKLSYWSLGCWNLCGGRLSGRSLCCWKLSRRKLSCWNLC